MRGQGDLHATGGWELELPQSGASFLALALLAGCNAVLGLDASTLEESSATGTTASSAASTTTVTSTTSTSSSSGGTTSSGGDGGAGGESASTSSGGGGGDAGGGGGDAGGGGYDPCGPGTWGILENGGFECGLDPWKQSGGAELETFTPGYGDRGTAARFETPDVTNPVYQPLGQVELAASTCFVASYAARSSDGSGQIAASLVITDSPGHFLQGPLRSLGTSFAHQGPLTCKIPSRFVGTYAMRFTFTVPGLTDGAKASIDSVEATLEPCAGGEVDCVEP